MAGEDLKNPKPSKTRKRSFSGKPEKNQPTKPANLLWYHRPKTLPLNRSPIPRVSKQSKALLKALSSYHIPKSPLRDFIYPRSKSAAVLVALFVGRHGDLYVLLNRRSSELRSYAGDTSLPGGKVDPEDKTLEDTARREAFEEIGLPRDRTKVPLLCVLEPFLASNSTMVTPVVVLILDNTLQPILNAAEVTSLFSHPLSSFLSDEAPYPNEPEGVYVPYHTHVDLHWPEDGYRDVQKTQQGGDKHKPRGPGGGESIRPVRGLQWKADDADDRTRRARVRLPATSSSRSVRRRRNSSASPSSNDDWSDAERELDPRQARGVIRMHRFLTGREAGGVKPVYGLTASILIRVAVIAHGILLPMPATSHESSRARERVPRRQPGATSSISASREASSRPSANPAVVPIDIYPPPTATSAYYSFTPSMEQRIAYSVLVNSAWREAYEREGFDVRGWGLDPPQQNSNRDPSDLRPVKWDLLRRVADVRREGNWGVVDGRLLDFVDENAEDSSQRHSDGRSTRRRRERSKL